MNCRQVQALLEHQFAAGGRLPGDAALHLDKCERCRGFREFLEDAPSSPAWHPSDCIHQRIRATIIQSLEPVSPLAPEWKLLAGLIGTSFLLPGFSVAVLGGGGLHQMLGWQVLGVVALIGSSIAFASVSLIRQLVPGSYEKVPPTSLITVVLAALTAGMISLFPWKDTRMFAPRGIPCLGKGLLVTILAAALLYMLVRRGVFLAGAWAGATVGLLAGMVGLAVLQLNCTLLEAPHIAVWHIGVVIASSSLGFVRGKVGIGLAAR